MHGIKLLVKFICLCYLRRRLYRVSIPNDRTSCGGHDSTHQLTTTCGKLNLLVCLFSEHTTLQNINVNGCRVGVFC